VDFTEARDSERQWHQLGHMHVGTRLPAGCAFCRPTNSVEALKARSEEKGSERKYRMKEWEGSEDKGWGNGT